MRAAAATFFATQTELPTSSPNSALSSLTFKPQAPRSGLSAPPATGSSKKSPPLSIPANRVLAARVAIDNGLVTDTLLDVPTDEGKVSALHSVGLTAPDAVFGNSVHDAHMLAIGRRAFPVNPSPALLQRSAQEGWPVYYPASVAPSP